MQASQLISMYWLHRAESLNAAFDCSSHQLFCDRAKQEEKVADMMWNSLKNVLAIYHLEI
jgi:hypothetical protein